MSPDNHCIFCNIINRSQKADILYEDDDLVIFKDIKPAAKFHVLVVPKEHIKDARSLRPDQKELVQKLIEAGKKILDDENLDLCETRTGFHWPPFNSISHLHLHVINPTTEMSFISRAIFKPNTWWFVTPDYVLSRLSSHL